MYPILTPSRLLSDLSGVWDFQLDNGHGFRGKVVCLSLERAYDHAGPAPHNDLKEGVDFRDHYGWVFYQRKISIPAFAKSQRIGAALRGGDPSRKVYLNGELLCEHRGGFLPFEVEITEKLRDGADNLLTIAVDNVIDYTTLPVGGKSDMMAGMAGMGGSASQKPENNPNFDFFNYCGITRPVKIYTPRAKAYIDDITLVPEVNGTEAKLTYSVDVVGEGDCLVQVFDREGNQVAQSQGTQGVLNIPNVHLWQPLNAYLYDVRVTVWGGCVYLALRSAHGHRWRARQFLDQRTALLF